MIIAVQSKGASCLCKKFILITIFILVGCNKKNETLQPIDYSTLDIIPKGYQYKSCNGFLKTTELVKSDLRLLASIFSKLDKEIYRLNLKERFTELLSKYISLDGFKCNDFLMDLNSFFNDSSLDHFHFSKIKKGAYVKKKGKETNEDFKIKLQSSKKGKFYEILIPSFKPFLFFGKEFERIKNGVNERLKYPNYLGIHLGGEGGDILSLVAMLSFFYKSEFNSKSWDQEYPLPYESLNYSQNRLVYSMRKNYFTDSFYSGLLSSEKYKKIIKENFNIETKDVQTYQLIHRFEKSYSKKNKLVNPNLRVFITADDSCMSSCETFILAMIKQLDAVFIGQRTRGDHYFPQPGTIYLKNIGVRLKLPTSKITYKEFVEKKPFTYSLGVEPDLYVKDGKEFFNKWINSKYFNPSKGKKEILVNLKNFLNTQKN